MDLPQLSPEELAKDVSPMVIGVVSMCLVIATGILALRLWTRYHILQKVGWDDYVASFSLLLIWGCGVSVAVMTRYGLGRHQQTVGSLEEYIKELKCFWCAIFFYGYAHLFLKMAFLVQYYKALCTPRMQRACIAAMILIGLWVFADSILIFNVCSPLAGFWDPRVPARCVDRKVMYYSFSAFSIATDVIIYLMPLPSLYRLSVPRSQKIYLLSIFSLGFFVVVIAVIRLQFVGDGPDVAWDNVESSLWSIGELTGAMLCLCLPTLRVLGSRLGFVSTRVVSSETPASANQNIAGPPGVGLTTIDTVAANSPKKSTIASGDFMAESEQFHNGGFRQTPSLAAL
ncbi:hypothetical protein LY76DRAFT_340301 [Colletotrichum caudatum]|nr:hypothetical protein LY76DRAFT_340301 [Colletotrichum caudatum]